MSNEVGMPDLSPDIIVDILSRLPVKSVCRFRCVSKSWLHLTTEPHFIETHLNRTQRQKIILSSNNSLFSLDHEAPIDDDMLPVELDFPLKGEPCPRWVQMLGSCNGLVCIMPVPENIFIFNPSTGESMRVPDCPMPIQDGDPPVDFDVHSFGYAPSINDYKFIKITCGCFLFIFSLKNNSWKRLEDFPYKYLSDDSGTVLNRAVHWLCECPGGPCVIVAFDLAEEKFSELPPPESVTDHKKFTTGILRGCLCLLHQHDNWKRSFWVMKEYNVKESWTTIWITDSYFALKPLCYWKNTKILLARNRKQLLLCNPKDGTCKKLVANGLPVPFYAITYVESLVSPNFLSRTNGCI